MTLTNRDYQEKRDFIRMKVNTPVKVILTQEDQGFEGLCQDLSGGGMLLSLDQSIDIGTELIVQLDSEHGHHPSLQARCQVARSNPGPDNSILLGLEIIEIIEQGQPAIEAVG